MHSTIDAGPSGPPGQDTHRGKLVTASRLSLMMLLEFIVFGSWFATLGLVLATHGLAAIIGDAYLLSAIAAIVSPLFLGAVGDRYLASQKVMALTHTVGALAMLALPSAVESGQGGLTLLLVFGYMLAFQPTLGLVNVIALRHLPDRDRLFPYVRVFAPIGWVVAGLGVGAMGLSGSPGLFYVTAAASLLFAAYSLTLPPTPPRAAGTHWSLGDLIGIDALVLFRDRSFAVLMICALMTSISLGMYNAFASPFIAALGIANVAGVLTIGQISEVVFLAAIPVALARLGMKWSLLIGMGMWGVRFILFMAAAHGDPAWAVLGIALHGICNDFFLVIAAMYIDRIAPASLAAQAQSWLILVISGFGQALGSFLAGTIFGRAVAPNLALGPAAWTPLWQLPIGIAVVTALVWVVFFRPHATPTVAGSAPAGA